MKTFRILATCLAVLLAAGTLNRAQAQPKAPAAGGAQPPAAQLNTSHGIAVVDVGYVFDNYGRVKGEQEAWKRDMDTVGASLKKEDEAIAKTMEKLKSLKPGTPEFKKLEEEIAQRASDLKVKFQLQEKEFNDRRAQIVIKAYHEVSAQVKSFAERNGISLVLQFNGAPVDQNNPRSVQAEVAKLVVYQKGIDITPMILDELNRRNPAPTASQQNRAGQPPQQIRK